MDLFELSDVPGNRERGATDEVARRKGARRFFTRWMEASREEAPEPEADARPGKDRRAAGTDR